MAGPAGPLHDLASGAIAYTALRPDRYWPRPGCQKPPDRPTRLRLFCDAYDIADRLAVLDAIQTFQRDSLAETLEFGARNISPYRTFLARGEDRLRRLELGWLAENREALERPLR